MKKQLSKSLSIYLLLGLYLLSGSVHAASLKVVIEGIKEKTGNVQIILFDSEAAWLNKGINSVQLAVSENTVTWEIMDLEPGQYGLYAFQDVNGDNQMNKGAFGKPTEPYGFSNGARGLFGPAVWEDAIIEVKAGENETVLKIK